MIKHELYDIAVAEVRGQADPHEKELLHSNVFSWRDALQQVIDEVESQFDAREEEFQEEIRILVEDSNSEKELDDIKTAYDIWKSRARTFKKHVNARLLAVKRMCQDKIEQFDEHDIDIEAVLGVVNIARKLIEADEDQNDDEFDDSLFRLKEALSMID